MADRGPVDAIASAMKETLEASGFTSRGRTWHLECEDAIVLVNLQKSGFGRQFYINLGIFLKELATPKSLKEQFCHVRLRANDVISRGKKSLETALDTEASQMEPAERVKVIASALTGKVVPLLLECGTRPGLKKAYDSGVLDEAFIHGLARSLLAG